MSIDIIGRMIASKYISPSDSSLMLYSGIVVEPTWQYNNGGTITIGEGTYRFYHTTDFSGVISEHVIPETTITITDDTTSYIIAQYNNGSPRLVAITDITSVNDSLNAIVYTVYRYGDSPSVILWDDPALGLANKLHRRLIETRRFERVSGLDLGETGTRNITVLAGKVWEGSYGNYLLVTNSATDEAYLRINNGDGTWTRDAITQYPNTQWDNASGTLQTLTDGNYAVIWVYRSMSTSKKIHFVLGNGDYDFNQANTSQPPSIPNSLVTNAMLVGRIIVLKGASTATQIDSAFTTQFAPSTITDHENLTGIMGGDETHHYHSDQQINKNNDVEFNNITITTDILPKTTLVSKLGSLLKIFLSIFTRLVQSDDDLTLDSATDKSVIIQSNNGTEAVKFDGTTATTKWTNKVHYPATDTTDAFNFTKADKTTSILKVDTTNTKTTFNLDSVDNAEVKITSSGSSNMKFIEIGASGVALQGYNQSGDLTHNFRTYGNSFYKNSLGVGVEAASKVHVDGGNATATNIKITNGTTTGVTATDGFDIGIDTSGNADIRQRENLPLTIYTNNTERIKYDASGEIKHTSKIHYPATDAVDAFNFTKADKVTSVLEIDTSTPSVNVTGTLTATNISGVLEVKPDNYLYVSKNGNDITGDGSANKPYLTIQKSINIATAGTTVFIFPATYTEDITLKAGVNLTTSAKYNTYIVGTVTADFIGTIFAEKIIFKSATGIVLDFKGIGVQNFQCEMCNFESIGTNVNSAINWTNTNSSSKISLSDGVATAYSSVSGARAFTSSSSAAGSLIASNTTFQILDDLDNICFYLAGSLTFAHTLDAIKGQFVTADTSRFIVSLINMTTNTVPILVHNSTNITPSVASSIVVTTTASPVITGIGAFAHVAIMYGGTGVGGSGTINGGLGPIGLPMGSIKLRASSLVPANQILLGYNTGALEFTGSDLYHTINTNRYKISIYPEVYTSHTLYVDNSRIDTYTPDGSISKPYKDVQSAHDAVPSGTSSSNIYIISVKLGLPYTGDLNITKDFITILGDGGITGAGYHGTVTSTSKHLTLKSVNITSGSVVNQSGAGHFLLEIKDCHMGGTLNVTAIGTDAEKNDSYIQVTGDDNLWMDMIINITGIRGFAGMTGGAYIGNTVTITDSYFCPGCSCVDSNVVNLETDSESEFLSMYAVRNTINLKTDATLYADITALANLNNTLNNTGGTLIRVSDAQVQAGVASTTGATTGSLFYKNALGNLVSLGIGTIGQTLKSDGTIPYWG